MAMNSWDYDAESRDRRYAKFASMPGSTPTRPKREDPREEEESEEFRRLRRLSEMGPLVWPLTAALKTEHFRQRADLRGLHWVELRYTWERGDWIPDPAVPGNAGWLIAWRNLILVVVFEEETPKLVTVKVRCEDASLPLAA